MAQLDAHTMLQPPLPSLHRLFLGSPTAGDSTATKRPRSEPEPEPEPESEASRTAIAIAVDPAPIREFHHMWQVDPTATDAMLGAIASCQEGAAGDPRLVFTKLHFFADDALRGWSGHTEDRYGSNTLSVSFRALGQNGTFEWGDEWENLVEEGFFAAAYVSLWLVKEGFGLDEFPEDDAWRTRPAGIEGGRGAEAHLRPWKVDRADHELLLRIASETERWDFEEYGGFYVYDRGGARKRIDKVLIPTDRARFSPVMEVDPASPDSGPFGKAARRVQDACPYWIPRVVLGGLTPEIAWTPYGDSPRERMVHLLKCVTAVTLEWPAPNGVYEYAHYALRNPDLAGTDEAFAEYAEWWKAHNLSVPAKRLCASLACATGCGEER